MKFTSVCSTPKKISRTLISSAVLLALSACSTSEPVAPLNPKMANTPASMEFVRNVEGINEYRLSNGMKVLLYPDQAQSKVLVNVTYRVGSVHENYGETGMAHLLEHMLFKGSTNYKDIDKEFNKRGMRANATTWLDRTNYYQSFESTTENLEWALGMEADRMINATFTKEQLDSEMTVVRNEMERGENSPSAMLSARMDSTAFLWHNYANSTIGARSDVENFPFDKLRRFYDKHYRPDNAVLTIAGRFDQQHILEAVTKTFGKLAQPETEIEKLYTVEPVQDGERLVTLRRTGEIPIVAVQYHIPSALHGDSPAIKVLEEIMSNNARGRLQKELVEPGVSSSSGAWSFLRKDPSSLTFLANGFKGKDFDEMENKLISLVENIKENKITEEEVKLAKASILKATEDSLRNVVSVGSTLTEYIAMGDYRYIFYLRDLVEQVKLEDVQRVAEKYLIRSNRTLGRFIPTKKPVRAHIEEDPSIAKQLVTYKGKEVVEAGEVYDNTVSNIEKRLQEFVWGMGTTVSVYPKKLRAGEINFFIDLPTGNIESLSGYEADFGLMAGLFYSGSKQYSKEQISTKLDELKASVNISSRRLGHVTIGIKAMKENLEPTLDFVSEIITNPLFTEEEINIDRKQTISALEKQRNEPRDVAISKLRQSFSGYPESHPKAFKTIDQRIDGLNAITQERLKDVHKRHLNFNNGHIGVVGDVDPAAISVMMQNKFGHLTSDTKYVEMEPSIKLPNDSVNWIETPDKANSQIYIAHRVELSRQHPDYHAAIIANSIWGGSGFASRLMQRIRVKEGYSYGTGSALHLEFDKRYGVFLMGASAAPENMPKVVEAYKEEVNKALTEGFTQQELDNAIEGELKDLRSSWANDARIAAVLSDNKELGRDLAWFTDYQEKLKALTLAQVNQAFKTYIAKDKLNIFAAGDFAKVANSE